METEKLILSQLILRGLAGLPRVSAYSGVEVKSLSCWTLRGIGRRRWPRSIVTLMKADKVIMDVAAAGY